MTTRLKPWSLRHLVIALQEDLENCTSDFERANAEAICRIEMKALYAEIIKTRKLTPGEQAIAEEYQL